MSRAPGPIANFICCGACCGTDWVHSSCYRASATQIFRLPHDLLCSLALRHSI